MMPPKPPSDCADLLRGMLGFNTVTASVSGRDNPEFLLAQWLAELAGSWGLESQWLPVEGAGPNLLLTHAAGADLPWWLFDSHLDTVDVAGMTIDPFGGETRKGRVYGRGACDTKGTGAAMLWAAKQAIEAGSLGCNVAILFSVGEEFMQVGARSFVEHDLAKLGWRPAGIFVGEPTSMQVVAASNGFLRCKMVTHGTAAHSSTPHLGRNAVTDMARAILAVESGHIAQLDIKHEMTGRSTCSINQVAGGVQHNIVPERCQAQIDHRLAPGDTAEQALSSIRIAIEPLQSADPDFRFELIDIQSAAPFDNEASRKLAAECVLRLAEAGIDSSVTGAPFTSDANHFAQAGLPCVVLGPGDLAQAHTRDEWIALDQLEQGLRGYRALMETGPATV